ncbi:MAG: glycosyltransferase family 2 protein [Bacteroidota bacterium]
MKVTGFSFIRNALIYDYPIVEAVRSILPICDDFVLAVGKSDDDTLSLVQQIDPQKISIVETVWDDSMRKGGKVLAAETNKAFQRIPKESDWAFYIQGDEVVHERYLGCIQRAMLQFQSAEDVDALLFKYLHFYGSYDYVGASNNWYKNEIRVIKNDPSFYSYHDAQGFRKGENQKLRVVPIDAYVYHYGWVKKPDAMQRKREHFNRYWHDDEWMKENILQKAQFEYGDNINMLKLFEEEHPKVMQERIASRNWYFDYDISMNRPSPKDRIKALASQYLGIELGYKNYKINTKKAKELKQNKAK